MLHQPDDPGVDVDYTPPPHMSWMTFIIGAVVGAIVIVLAIIGAAHAQVMDQEHRSCDLFVNDHRITWPAGMLSKHECELTRDEIKAKDATRSDIKCRCENGGRT